MAHGGARPGTGPKTNRIGRPPKPKTPEERNEAFDIKAQAALPELFETILAIAQGYKVGVFAPPRKGESVEMVTTDGDPIWVYAVPPDKAAVMYIVDRAAGKSAVKSAEQTETELTLEVMLPDDE